MKQFIGALALTGLLASAGATAQAQILDFTVTVPSAMGGNNNLVTTGVNSDHKVFNTTLTPFTTEFTQESVVSFGVTQQGGGSASMKMDTYTNVPAAFTFDVQVDDGTTTVTKTFQVSGVIKGSTNLNVATGKGGSSAYFQANSLMEVGGGTVGYVAGLTSPVLVPSLELAQVDFSIGKADIYVDRLDALTAPNSFTNLSIGGYILQDVPEPGAVAMTVGLGVSALGLLTRRRKR
jgi:hypothetical protein